MNRAYLYATLGIAALCCTARATQAQSPAPAGGYPLEDVPVTLPSGTVVRVRDVIVFAGAAGKTLTLYIQSAMPASDSAALARDARALVDRYGASGELGPLARVIVGICRTQACLEMRAVPSEMFEFVAGPDGSWRVVPSPTH